MTRNRNRRDKIRQPRQNGGIRHAAAARHQAEQEQRSRPVQDLLADAAEALHDSGPADVSVVLRRAWTAVCLTGAAVEVLAACSDSVDDRARCQLAREPLAAAVSAMRAVPYLRGSPATANPAGSPDDRITGPAAAAIREAVFACCDVLHQSMARVPADARLPSAARACTAVAESAQAVGGIFRAPARPGRQAALPRPDYLPAGTPAALQAAVDAQLRELAAADPGETARALERAWYGFCLVAALGQYRALRDLDAAILHENALPVLARVIETMDTAPSLPSGVHGFGLDTAPDTEPSMMTIADRGIWDLTLAINALLPQVRELALDQADKLAATICTALAAELADCYQGRLGTFLR
jgi:hypothetical protein